MSLSDRNPIRNRSDSESDRNRFGRTPKNLAHSDRNRSDFRNFGIRFGTVPIRNPIGIRTSHRVGGAAQKADWVRGAFTTQDTCLLDSPHLLMNPDFFIFSRGGGFMVTDWPISRHELSELSLAELSLTEKSPSTRGGVIWG